MITCECSDMGCTVHRGFAFCALMATDIAYRVDMTDLTGTALCFDCAGDAYETGLYTDQAPVQDCPDGHLCERWLNFIS